MKESEGNKELPSHEGPDEKPDVQALLSTSPLESFTSSNLFELILNRIGLFLGWFGGGKVRISLTAGVLAGLVVLLGFVVFDTNRDRHMLIQKYPNASSWNERNYLYARDLVRQKEYDKAEPILRKLAGKHRAADFHADTLLLLAKSLGATAKDPATAQTAREAYDEFMSEYPADPHVPSAHMQLAEVFSACGMFAESNEEYEKLWRMLKDPEEKGEVEVLIAQNQCHEANLLDAIELLDKVRHEHPDTVLHLDSTLLLGRALTEIGRPEDADPLLRHLVEEAPGSMHASVALRMLAQNALKTGANKESIAYCEQWMKESPAAGHEVEIMLILANARLAMGQPAEASGVASEIKRFFPKSPKLAEAVIMQGRSFEALGQMGDAKTTYLQAADMDQKNPLPHERLAHIFQSGGKLTEAMEQMKYACADAPNNDAYSFQLAKLYRLNGENVNAAKILDEFTHDHQLSPFIGDASLLLADIQIELGDLPDAYQTINHLLATITTTVPESVVFEKRADILAQVGLYDEALDAYRSASYAGGHPAVLNLKIAQTLFASGKVKECLHELTSVNTSKLSADEQFELDELKGRVCSDMRMFREARNAIQEAIALRTGRENFSTLALLMQSNLALNDESEAAKVFDLTLKLIETDQTEAPPEARHIVLEWAQRLYEKGKYADAVKVYSTAGKPQFPAADAAWALYQQGNCWYQMANFARAKESYTRLAKEFSDSEWVGFAQQKQEIISLKART